MNYKQFLISLFAVFALLANSACTTTTGFERSDGELMQAKLKAGDTVRIVELSGSEYDLTIEEVTPNSLIGERPYLGRVEVPFSDMDSATLERIAPVKTAGAVVGGTVLVAVAGVILVAAALSGDMAPTY